MVGPEEAEQNQGDHSQGIGKWGGAPDNAQGHGEQRRGAHNSAWVGGEGFLEVVMF